MLHICYINIKYREFDNYYIAFTLKNYFGCTLKEKGGFYKLY